jgi:hypothetical protein
MLFETLFLAANLLVLACWLGLVAWPGSRIVVDGIAGFAVPALLGIAYAGLIGAYFFDAAGGFGSLAAVQRLFMQAPIALAGWLHYLAFDLFVGAWIVRTARAEGIRHRLVVPCLIFTFLLGPLGFLLFAMLRFAAAQARPQEV